MILSEKEILSRIMAYCSKSEQCLFSVRKKLSAWNIDDELADKVIAYLIDEKFLDETRFCEFFIHDTFRFNKWGPAKIGFELRKRQIPDSVFNPILKKIGDADAQDLLISLLTAKNGSIKAKDIFDRKNKLLRFALGRGFSMDLAIGCIKLVLNENYDSVE